MANLEINITSPLKIVAFHPIKMPLDALSAGMKANLLKLFGVIFQTAEESNWGRLVS
jgi:hypothetical protein